MTAFIWLLLVCGAYGALTLWVADVMRAYRFRRAVLSAALLTIPPVLLFLTGMVPSAYRIVGFEAGLALLTLTASRLIAPGEPLAPARETRPAFLHLVLLSGSALFLVPFVWMVVTSLKEDSQMSHFPPEWVPTQQVTVMRAGRQEGLVRFRDGSALRDGAVVRSNPDGTLQVEPLNGGGGPRVVPKDSVTEVRHFDPVWKNYPDALKFLPKDSNYGLVNLQNTLIIALMSVFGTILSSSLVAYSFSRLRWPGRDWLFGLVLATMMLPDAVTMMPRFLIFRDLHWVDTLYPLWAPSFFAAAFNVFLLRQFFMGIPKELEDASRIDGCTYFGTYWRVMLPMVKPALAAVTIMTFIGAWKDFMNPLIYISSPEKMPLSYVLQLFNSSHGGEPGMLMAATTLVMLPVIVLFFFTQRYFIEGVTLTGLGGR